MSKRKLTEKAQQSYSSREKHIKWLRPDGLRRPEASSGYLPPALSWLPDWRDRSVYEKLTAAHSSKDWAWEFLRRNPDYISKTDGLLYEKNLISFTPSEADIVGTKLQKLASGELIITHTNPQLQKLDGAISFLADRYGLLCFPPRSSNNKPYIEFQEQAIIEDHAELIAQVSPKLIELVQAFKQGRTPKLKIENTINDLSQLIKMLFKAKRNRKVYIEYLRSLDGLECGASLTEIALVIHKNKVKKDNVKKQISRARELRDISYQLLGVRGTVKTRS